MTESVWSPLVATGRFEESVIRAEDSTAGRRSWQRGEANSKKSDRSPLVVSESGWGEEVVMSVHGSQAVAGAGGGQSSQKLTARPWAIWKRGREGARASH